GMAPAERQPPEVVDVSAVAHDVVGLEMLGGGERRESRKQEAGSRKQEEGGSDNQRVKEAGFRGEGEGNEGREAVVDGGREGKGERNGVVRWRLVGAEEPIQAVARADELREVLLNILENARLAGASTVELHCGRRDGRVVIEVIDDGSGVPAHVLPRLFEPHFSTRSSGSGLGLAMSRQIVESWGGAIAIASTEGEGTRVRIELTAHDGAAAEEAG
ncbi:MAG TPA: ATP-binding protein, partial [Gemmatimonadaceae bacterium]|nr:ATP-binding protein [Gemmatimonadaceae bacterium]